MFETLGLFLGSLLDATIGPNLVVPGEPFMIAAGYQLYSGGYLAVFAVLLGGLFGDQLSYFIGHHYGFNTQKRLLAWQPKVRRPLARCRLMMSRHTFLLLAFSRLLGPIAWVMPFMAGANRIQWRTFSLYASIGLILGIGQFVIWGYLLAAGLNNIPLLSDISGFLSEHKYSLGIVILTLVLTYCGFKKHWRYLWVKACGVFIIGILSLNYSHFFWFSDDAITPLSTSDNSKTVDLNALSYKVFAGRSSIYSAQALNIIYLGESPTPLMQTLGWIQNKTFSRNELEFWDYVNLLRRKTPPVSDLNWNGEPQHLAFQLPGTLTKRSHVRWWKAGTDALTSEPIWVGALSFDNGLAITPYSGIVTILHRVSPDVDRERDKLKDHVLKSNAQWHAEKLPLTAPIAIDNRHDYFTDGDVLVLSPSKTVDATNAL
ncbi:LssY C-terminal domain-containing protein [Vibrio methylphosphonaticus]|uniref:LssY C-terminal domain-containing protein n=1 Tax=Vibrio methylphosphonaticus TaxID=2946866 RepID=UPI00202AB79A|nr:LssY C-terminal domain-containing protein [Vibrio methylphosphonaticus]MCL9774150.1 LssY C-terminal domain-containing protein [Vibrio methylphosphonaticus]